MTPKTAQSYRTATRFTLIILLIISLLTLVLTPWLDLELERLFYSQEGKTFSNTAFTQFLYDYGEWPGLIIGALSLIVYFISKSVTALMPYRKSALAIFLTLLIGAGLLINLVFKENWGRPRPKQIEEFGGVQRFHPFYEPDFDKTKEPSKSFPCGHCAMGFYFMALTLAALRLRKKWLFWTALLLTFGLGIALSYARIAQGGHYLSDTIISAILMISVAYLCDYWVHRKDEAALP